MNIRKLLVNNTLNPLLVKALANKTIRNILFKQIISRLYDESMKHDPGGCPTRAKLDRLDLIYGLFSGFDRLMDRGIVSKPFLKHLLNSLIGNVFLNEDARRLEKAGLTPPSFVTISPTGKCNLRCSGCYAADAALHGKQLNFDVYDRILREKSELWGSHWTVISGGEPFLWRDGEWDLIEVAKRHPNDVFMVYTNGTLIDQRLAERIAEAGNISPAISVEGFEKETDARRGKGTHQKVLTAFQALRTCGVPFAISVTATKENWDLITSDEFIDYYFMDQGAHYGWIFQYMPMGRGQTLDMVVPPESRVEMSRRMWKLVRERKIFLVDFWNSATVSEGCISAARHGGYFHINWDGDIMPCVFTPYAAGNINEIYANGGNLNDTIGLPFFKKIRQWQSDYGFHKPVSEIGNWLCPCLIRDHFDVFAEAVTSCEARPINKEAEQAINDSLYYQGMVDYGQQMAELTNDAWQSDYVGQVNK